jgi:hypothetical protein
MLLNMTSMRLFIVHYLSLIYLYAVLHQEFSHSALLLQGQEIEHPGNMPIICLPSGHGMVLSVQG